ncbi:uncharacterized protein PV07_00113 [Cladophialophora immunda]|uniref:Uncharacterized protein n=1 Tax=Cladophialophora immunda TaxID=569365 RepID=A0A0D2B6L0_9EURO|nr:uncharacterized protein PV07_00113 [Cladophialophora immunda]KIW33247.1 hypothetical protein PV07_00113 [Cladophialophora immunda]
MANHLSFVTLDVFTSTRYTGNPLALVKVPRHIALSQSQKQRIAREFNLSETVFLHEQTPADIAEDDHAARVDIFTAHAEVPFAGHPTVGTANYLLRLLGDDAAGKNVKALRAKAGRIPITLDPAADGVQISVAHNVHVHNAPYAGKPFGQYPVVSIVRGMTFILARLPDLAALAAATENLVGRDATYTSAPGLDAGWREGIVVTYFFVDTSGPQDPASASASDAASGADTTVRRSLRTRCLGSREDPATGSAACALAAYLALQAGRAGRHRYAIVQGVEMGQRSEIFVDVGVRPAAAADGGRLEIEEVLLSGSAVQVMQGSLEVPAPDGLS